MQNHTLSALRGQHTHFWNHYYILYLPKKLFYPICDVWGCKDTTLTSSAIFSSGGDFCGLEINQLKFPEISRFHMKLTISQIYPKGRAGGSTFPTISKEAKSMPLPQQQERKKVLLYLTLQGECWKVTTQSTKHAWKGKGLPAQLHAA